MLACGDDVVKALTVFGTPNATSDDNIAVFVHFVCQLYNNTEVKTVKELRWQMFIKRIKYVFLLHAYHTIVGLRL